ncbi:MAG: ATPase [Bacteroidales bacterium]|nr:ATPase [Bacteroidales bacterium]
MKLIADSGSTKVDWRIIFNDGSIESVGTPGINPVFLSDEHIINVLKENLLPVAGEELDEVYFYGAGVIPGEITDRMENCFKRVFPKAKCEFYSDVLAAAHALCGHEKGIACIMGTGSNSCFYDGEKIAANVKAGGFILGDEASGGYFGKKFIADFVKGLLPEEINNEFIKRYNLDYLAIVQKVYKEPLPSRFLASFLPFIGEYREHPHIANLLTEGFNEFFKRNIVHYDYKNYSVNIVGSIAYYFRDFVEKAAEANGMKIGKIIKAPIDGLIEFYK